MKKNYLLLFSLYVFLAFHCAAQPVFNWSASFGGTANDLNSLCAVDAAHNTYAASYLAGSFDADPGAGVFMLEKTSSAFDFYIIKLTASGNFAWARRIQGEGNCLVATMNIASDGGLIIAGKYSGTIDFDPGAGVYNKTAPLENTMFILKVSADGDFIWMQESGQVYGVNDQALDHAGNIVIVGAYTEATDFDPGAGVTLLPDYYNQAVFVAKFDPDGNFMWAKNLENIGTSGVVISISKSIEIAQDNSILLTGSFDGLIDFDPGAGVHTMEPQYAVNYALFFEKLDADGNYVYASQFDRLLESDGGDFMVIDNDDNAYVINPGYDIIYVLKYAPDGSVIWSKKLEYESSSIVSFEIDQANSALYISGTYSGTQDYYPGPGVAELTSFFTTGYLVKFDLGLRFQWVQSIGSDTYYENPREIVTDETGGLYVALEFSGTPEIIIGDTVLHYTSAGSKDFIIMKLTDPDICALNNAVSLSDDAAFCKGGSVLISAFSDPSYTYQWQRNGNDISGATTSTVVATKTGTYQAVISNGTCNSTSENITITVYPKPASSVINQDATNDLCIDSSIKLKAGGGGAGAVFQWYNGATAIPGATGNIYNAVSAGNYKVSITNTYGCSRISPAFAIIQTCKLQSALTTKLALYPNPNAGQFILQVPQLQYIETADMVLQNTAGQTMFTQSVHSGTNEIMTGLLPVGLYIATVTDGENRYTVICNIQ